MNQFHDTPITDLETGRTFLHRSYCESPAQAAAYARQTFANPKLYAIGLADEPAVAAAKAYAEGWKDPAADFVASLVTAYQASPPPPPNAFRVTFLPTETETITVQTELF
jgi:hypothetical protein